MNYILLVLPLVVLIYYMSRKDIKKSILGNISQVLVIVGYAVIIYAIIRVKLGPSDFVGWGSIEELGYMMYGAIGVVIGTVVLILKMILKK